MAATIPAAALVLSFTIGGIRWPVHGQAARTRLQADVLLAEAALLVLIAPLLGVDVVVRRRVGDGATPALLRHDARGAIWPLLNPLLVAATMVTAISAALAVAIVGPAAMLTTRPFLFSHAMLWGALLAFAGGGACAAVSFDDPLDAAAAAVATSLIIGGAIFAFGPLLSAVPAPLVKVSALVNPIVAISTAADIDIFRMDLFYRVSPLAHMQFDYPASPAALAIFVVGAATSLGVACRFTRCDGFQILNREGTVS